MPTDHSTDDFNLRDLADRLTRGIPQIVGFGIFGFVACLVGYIVICPLMTEWTTTRVTFAFEGYDIGEYPDHSKFQAEDIITPVIIAEALNSMGIDASQDIQSKVRSAISIEGIVPASVIKERDRLRALGQPLKILVPDEYQITLQLPRRFSLSAQQREQLLDKIVAIYRTQFKETYAEPPFAFGNAFKILKGADMSEYELILSSETENIISYLQRQYEADKSFRSPTTDLSFGDLLRQTQIFVQTKVYETLGMIQENGPSGDHALATMRLNYYLRTLEDRENRAMEQEKVVRNLLDQALEHSQGYVLGAKSQLSQPRSDTPLLDKGLIDSLLAADSYNMLVRKALDAGSELKRVQSEKAQLLNRIKRMDEAAKKTGPEHDKIVEEVRHSLVQLESSYTLLVDRIAKTQKDFANQKFGDAVRITGGTRSTGILAPLVEVSLTGALIGSFLGVGLSFLGFYIGNRPIK